MNRFSFLFGWPRSTKIAISVAIDTCVLIIAGLIANYIRLESFDLFLSPVGLQIAAITVLGTLLFLHLVGTYKTILRFSGVTLAQNMAVAVIGSAAILAISSFYFQFSLPRTVPVVFGVFAWCGLTLPRFVLRTLYQRTQKLQAISVAIYGAGEAGRKVQSALFGSQDLVVSCFIDDNPALRHSSVHNLKVYGPDEIARIVGKFGLQKIILALPGIGRVQRNAILKRLEPLSVEVLTIPNLSDLLTGKAKIDQVQQVDIFDLLGRERILPYPELLKRHLQDRNVLVTGAGGSIGSELARQIIQQAPKCLVLYEKNEFALYVIEQELSKLVSENGLRTKLIPILGSVQTYERLFSVFQRFSIDTLYHSAAYKHVPMVEHNVVEGIRNNVFGTYFTAKAAIDSGVKNFVLISTDKAVRPTNIMGATKRYAELICQGFAEDKKIKTNFSMVRFGNVLGSSGSVVPVFREQIRHGGPVTVTHPDITRYFMTIPEAAQLVIQAGAMAQGGEVFVLDMGESVRIQDLAARMIHLSGFTVKPTGDTGEGIEITYSGLRPGEKLYEELLIGADVEETEHKHIMMANEMYLDIIGLMENIEELDRLCVSYDLEKIREHLSWMPLEFFPVSDDVDLVGSKAPVVALKSKLKVAQD